MFDQFWAILLQSGMKRKKLFPFMGSQSFIYKSSVIREEPEGTCVKSCDLVSASGEEW